MDRKRQACKQRPWTAGVATLVSHKIDMVTRTVSRVRDIS